jgi:hypothetical protein
MEGRSTIDTAEHVRATAKLEKAFAEIKLLKDQLYKENLALRSLAPRQTRRNADSARQGKRNATPCPER